MKNTLLISMLVSMFFWGLSWPSAKVITDYGASAVNLTIYRYSIVIVTLLPILLVFKIKLKVKKEGILFIVISGCLLAFYSYMMFLGLKYGSSGAGGVFVTTLNPIMAYLIGMVIARQRPNTNETIGLLLGLLAGCVLLRIWENLDVISSGGNLYFLLSAFLWSVMSRFTAKANSYGSPFSFSLWMYVVTFLVLLPFIDLSDLNETFKIRDFSFGETCFLAVQSLQHSQQRSIFMPQVSWVHKKQAVSSFWFPFRLLFRRGSCSMKKSKSIPSSEGFWEFQPFT